MVLESCKTVVRTEILNNYASRVKRTSDTVESNYRGSICRLNQQWNESPAFKHFCEKQNQKILRIGRENIENLLKYVGKFGFIRLFQSNNR